MERELIPFVSDAPAPAPDVTSEVRINGETFGPGASGGSWDRFAINEKLFGVKVSFDEAAYSTKLDRDAPDFKERERSARRIADEILRVSPVPPLFMCSDLSAVRDSQRLRS